MRRITILLAMLFFVTACKEEKTPTNEKQTILRINFASPPGSFNPHHLTVSGSLSIYSLLYDGLYRMGAQGKPVPSVAKSVDISPDGLKYTFHLRKTLWSNGDLVTAYDFENAWKLAVNPTNRAPFAAGFFVIKNGRAICEENVDPEWLGAYARDSETFVVELENPCPYFLDLITLIAFYPLHLSHLDSMNGPFMIETYAQDSYLKLIKNPNYWDADQIKLEGLDITFVCDSSTELYMFEKGDLDWAGQPFNGGLPLDTLNHLSNIEHANTLCVFYYKFNVNHPLLKSKKVRQALNLSVDRPQIMKYIKQGPDTPTHTFLLQENPPPIPSDAELLALFQEGWEEVGRPPLSFTLSYNNAELQSTMAQFVQSRWNKLFGLNVSLCEYEWKAYLHYADNGLYDCIRGSAASITNDPVAMLEIFEGRQTADTYKNWCHPEFQEAIQTARTTVDPVERMKILNKAIAIFNDETPLVPLYYQKIAYVKNPKLKGEVVNFRSYVDFKWAYFD